MRRAAKIKKGRSTPCFCVTHGARASRPRNLFCPLNGGEASLFIEGFRSGIEPLAQPYAGETLALHEPRFFLQASRLRSQGFLLISCRQGAWSVRRCC